MKATLRLVPIILILFALVTCTTRKYETRVDVTRMDEDPADSAIYRSDRGMVFLVTWGIPRSQKGTGALYDGSGAAVMNLDYRGSDVRLYTDSTDFKFFYYFQSFETPGQWRLAMTFEGKDHIEPINYLFTVEPPRVTAAPPSVEYRPMPCTADDGTIILDNFYQASPWEEERVKKKIAVWNWGDVIHEIKVRATICDVHEINSVVFADWETHLEQLTGKKIRQRQPSVHERIAAVMPAYEEEFMFVNPAFVTWFSQTMVPDPKAQRSLGWTYQEIYDFAIRNAGRRMALTYMYYKSLPDGGLDAQVQFAEIAARKYLNKEEERIIERDDFPNRWQIMNGWHEEAAEALVASHVPKGALGEYDYWFDHEELGFWLRRGIDGSADAVWEALRDVMIKYDGEWFKEYIEQDWAPHYGTAG